MSEESEIQPLKTIARGAGIVFIGIIVSKFISYFYRLFIARYFGPEIYGLFSLGLVVIGFASVFTWIGLPIAIRRYIALYRARGDEARVKGTISSTFKMVFCTSLFFAVVLFAFSNYIATQVFHETRLIEYLKILSIALPFYSLSYVVFSAFLGFQKVEYHVLSQHIFSNFAKLATVVVFGLLGFGFVGIAISWVTAWFITFIVSLYFFETRVYPILRSKIKAISLNRELFSYSLPLVGSTSMGMTIPWVGTTMLGYFKTVEEVGIYNVALPTAQFLFAPPMIFTTLFLPVITDLYGREKHEELKKVYKTVTRWIVYLNFPLFLIMFFFSKQVINTMFGPEYITGYAALMILCTGFMFGILAQILLNILMMLKKTKYILYNSFIMASVNVALNYILIPKYGMSGAAIATATAYTLSTFLLLTFSRHFLGYTPLSPGILKSIAAGVISILSVHYLARLFFSSFPIYILLMLFALFAILYGFLLLLFGGIEKEDLKILKAVEKKSGIKVGFLRALLKKFV